MVHPRFRAQDYKEYPLRLQTGKMATLAAQGSTKPSFRSIDKPSFAVKAP